MKRSLYPLLVPGPLLLTLALGCVPAGDGIPPNVASVYFPVALATDGDATGGYLYTLNSDFDLQFNRGTLQSYALVRLRELARVPCAADADCAADERCDTEPNERNSQVASFFCVDRTGDFEGLPCGPFPESTRNERTMSPGRCGSVDISAPQDDPAGEKTKLLHDTVLVSAFGTDLLRVAQPGTENARLFVPVRGDAAVQWLDLSDGKFHCGQAKGEQECDDAFRVRSATDVEVDDPNAEVTDEPVESVNLPPEPYGLAASDDGQRIVLTHLNAVSGSTVSGRVSALLNPWGKTPSLVSIQAGLPFNPVGVASVPMPLALEAGAYEHGFLVTFRNDANVRLLRLYDDGALEGNEGATGGTPRPFLRQVGSAPIATNSSGVDSRGVAVDPTRRQLAEAECAGDEACLIDAAEVPLDVFVANRSPSSLLIGETKRVRSSQFSVDIPSFYENIPLTEGPSRVVLGHVMTAEGIRERRVFVICFDSATIFVVDPIRRRVESQIPTGRGPQALAFDPDPNRALAYVAHFTDSYLGVLSLDQRFPMTYGAVVARIGTPTPPRASK